MSWRLARRRIGRRTVGGAIRAALGGSAGFLRVGFHAALLGIAGRAHAGRAAGRRHRVRGRIAGRAGGLAAQGPLSRLSGFRRIGRGAALLHAVALCVGDRHARQECRRGGQAQIGLHDSSKE